MRGIPGRRDVHVEGVDAEVKEKEETKRRRTRRQEQETKMRGVDDDCCIEFLFCFFFGEE